MIGRLAPHHAAAAMLEAMKAAGMPPRNAGEVAAGLLSGDLTRFPCEGDRGANGWAVLHLDQTPAGAFGNWRLGIKARWHCNAARGQPSRHDCAAHAVKMAQERQAKAIRQEQAANRAYALWQASQPAGHHPYLVVKRLAGAVDRPASEGGQLAIRRSGADLLIPMQTTASPLCNLQRIAPDGQKRFLPGGRLEAAFWCAGRAMDAPIICLGEGFATMAAVHLATGLPVAAAMSAGNLEAVALALHVRFPAARLILCADMDAGPHGNIGLTKARAAAAAVPCGLVAVPPRPASWAVAGRGWDFADVFCAGDAGLIRRALGGEG